MTLLVFVVFDYSYYKDSIHIFLLKQPLKMGWGKVREPGLKLGSPEAQRRGPSKFS